MMSIWQSQAMHYCIGKGPLKVVSSDWSTLPLILSASKYFRQISISFYPHPNISYIFRSHFIFGYPRIPSGIQGYHGVSKDTIGYPRIPWVSKDTMLGIQGYHANQVQQPMCLHKTSWQDLGADLSTVPPIFNSHFTRTVLYLPAPGIQSWECDRQPRRCFHLALWG